MVQADQLTRHGGYCIYLSWTLPPSLVFRPSLLRIDDEIDVSFHGTHPSIHELSHLFLAGPSGAWTRIGTLLSAGPVHATAVLCVSRIPYSTATILATASQTVGMNPTVQILCNIAIASLASYQ